MKAKLKESDLSNLKVSSKNKIEFKKESKKDTKEIKKSKKVKNMTLQPDDEFDKQLQNEVRMFLNSSQMHSDNETVVSPGKKTKKSKLADDDNNNNRYQSKHKLLNQKKYNTKVLKKDKLKQSTVTKLEKKKKKLKALIENNNEQESPSANNMLSENQIKQMEDKIDRKIKKLKKENSGEMKMQKKQEKVEMKQLFKKFDKLDIDHDENNLSKKSRKKAKFLKLQETSENLDEWKKNKKLARKLKKKEKRLEKRLNEKQMAVQSESKENEKGVQNKNKRNKKKRIHDEEETSPTNKKQKVNIDTVVSQINKMDLEETGDKLNEEKKHKKKKKSKKNNEKDIETKVDVDKEVNGTMSQSLQLNTMTSSGVVGCKKEKYFNSKHTPLREKLMNKLKAARFRYLNEQLYTSKSEESKDFFLKDPESFEAYHEGFKKQVTQWPINPIDIIIKSIQERESTDRLIIADLGCGEAKLAATLVQHKVHSLDLVAMNDRVTPCDMTRTPIKTGSVDIVVFCLALMGTDLAACIKEANRILKLGGEMKIAEVESRFSDVKEFIKDIQKYGFEKKVFNEDYSIFYFMDFKKVSNLSKTKKKKLPAINLKPCLYKKR